MSDVGCGGARVMQWVMGGVRRVMWVVWGSGSGDVGCDSRAQALAVCLGRSCIIGGARMI